MTAYDEIAEWYDAWLREPTTFSELVVPAVLELVGEVEGLRVCDLACGQGRVARELANRGARVVGVDVSARLLDMATRYDAAGGPQVRYVRADAQRLALGTRSIDGVVCNMSLMDIGDLTATLREVARILRPHGWFVFSITHPCFQTPRSTWVSDAVGAARRVAAYFEEGFWRSDFPDGIRDRVGAYHRTLGTYLNGLAEVGLAMRCAVEPRAAGAAAARVPGYAEVPAVLVARCQRIQGSAWP